MRTSQEQNRGNPNWGRKQDGTSASGNPGGRPKGDSEFKLKARAAVDAHVLEKWIEEVKTHGDEWMKASELLAAYGYGKPTQGIEVSNKTADEEAAGLSDGKLEKLAT